MQLEHELSEGLKDKAYFLGIYYHVLGNMTKMSKVISSTWLYVVFHSSTDSNFMLSLWVKHN